MKVHAPALALILAICSTPIFAQNVGQFPNAPGSAPPPADALDTAEIAKSLGPLAESLSAALSMDRSANGSVVFSQAQIGFGAVFFGGVQWLNDGGRQVASFAAPGSSLKTMPPLRLGQNYTLATWMKLPCPGNHAVVWDGMRDCPLFVTEDRFACSNPEAEHTFCTMKNLAGWHHVAVTCDGSQISFFLDGENRGQAPVVLDDRLVTIGTKTKRSAENNQCDALDDMFIFNRALKPEEIAQLSTVRLPVHEPTPADLARQNGRPGAPVNAGQAGAGAPDRGAANGASELVKTYHDSLVFVSGANGAGSGFLAKYHNAPYLFTNAHVAAGVKAAAFKTLNGDRVQIGATSAVAVGHDVVLMQATTNGRPFEIMQGVDKEASIGDAVVVLGNAEGAGVVNTITGKIVGIGPNLVEVDAPFVPGNSGSPIIHLKTGQVIGVATYVTIKKLDPVTKKSLAAPTVRHFGYRLDSIKSWQSINWQTFATQAEMMENIEGLTKDLLKLLNDVNRTGRITPGITNNVAIKSRIEAWQGQFHSRMSKTDINMANSNFIAYLRNLCRSDITAAQTSITYDYFRRLLTDEERDRNGIADIFSAAIESSRR